MVQIEKEHLPWHLSYQQVNKTVPSWSRHGMPALFGQFIELVKAGGVAGTHLDIGCGDAVKTVRYVLEGLPTLGVDISADGIDKARLLIERLGLTSICQVRQINFLDLKMDDGLAASSSDVLCFTHHQEADQERYLLKLHKLLKNGGYIMMVLFSDKDKHFHGHQVFKRYNFQFDPNNPLMEGVAHYDGMHNRHYSEEDIQSQFSPLFQEVHMLEIPHPLDRDRYLWNVILRKAG